MRFGESGSVTEIPQLGFGEQDVEYQVVLSSFLDSALIYHDIPDDVAI